VHLPTSDQDPSQRADDRSVGAIGRAAALLDPDDHADVREVAVALRDRDELVTGGGVGERTAGGVALDRDGEHHLGEDHAVGEREEGKGAHGGVGHGTSGGSSRSLGPTLV
jgi:hypothetical protein